MKVLIALFLVSFLMIPSMEFVLFFVQANWIQLTYILFSPHPLWNVTPVALCQGRSTQGQVLGLDKNY